MEVQSWTVRRMTLSTRRSSSDQLRRASCRISLPERGWFLMRKNRSKLRSHISSSNRSRVLPEATMRSIHWRIWPRRNSEGSSRSREGVSGPKSSLDDPSLDMTGPIIKNRGMDNLAVAGLLHEIADLLEIKGE